MSTRTNETTIVADAELPSIRISREFEAPPEKVFRAFIVQELFAQWIGPRSIATQIERWDATTGGHFRYSVARDGEQFASFYGSFHEVRPHERIVQTFTWEDDPDGVSLDTMTFVDLGNGRTRLESLSVVDTIEARDATLASGMHVGVNEGFEKLDELLAS